MTLLESKLSERFIFLCQEGKISELCVLLCSFTPNKETFYNGIEKAIMFSRANTINFLFKEFNKADPHFNNNKLFYDVLMIKNPKLSKSLLNKLMNAEKFDSNKIDSILNNFLQKSIYIQDRHIFEWKTFPFFKYLPKYLQISINQKDSNLKSKILNHFNIKNNIKLF